MSTVGAILDAGVSAHAPLPPLLADLVFLVLVGLTYLHLSHVLLKKKLNVQKIT
jgi:hypothetical protein